MAPDPFRLSIALVPIAAYLALLALVNIRRRPFLTTGGSDLATLGAACSGLVLVGPIELFRPQAASAQFGGYVWLFLLAFYWLWVWLAVLLSRPRLVVYNVSSEELRPLLSEVARTIDPMARWTGDSLFLPSLHLHLHMEPFEAMRNVSLVASGRNQSIEGWKRLSEGLRGELANLRVSRNPRSVGLMLVALSLMAICISQLATHPRHVAEAMEQMFAL